MLWSHLRSGRILISECKESLRIRIFPYTGAFLCIAQSAVGAGSTLRTAAAFLNGNVHSSTMAVIVMAAAGIIASDRRFRCRRNIVSTNIAVGFIVAVTAAYRVRCAGMMHTHAVQTAPAAFVVAAVGLGTVKITHLLSPPPTEFPPGTELCVFMGKAPYQIFTWVTDFYHISGLCSWVRRKMPSDNRYALPVRRTIKRL